MSLFVSFCLMILYLTGRGINAWYINLRRVSPTNEKKLHSATTVAVTRCDSHVPHRPARPPQPPTTVTFHKYGRQTKTSPQRAEAREARCALSFQYGGYTLYCLSLSEDTITTYKR